MKKIIQRLKNERGLTLVELLAVIVILAIIAVIAFVFIGGIIENSKKDAHIANAQQAIAAVKMHEATGGEIGSNGISFEKLQKEKYLEDPMLDPWTKKEYEGLKDAKVTKNGNEYRVMNFAGGGTGQDVKCTINNETEEDLLNKERSEICP